MDIMYVSHIRIMVMLLYYKSHAVGVTSEVGLTTDRRPFRAVFLLFFLLFLA